MTAPSVITSRLALIGAAALICVPVLGGCSSSSDSTAESPTPSDTASAAYCASVDTVRASLDALVSTNVIKDGTATLKSRFEAFQADVKSLTDSARANFTSESAAVDASVATLKDEMAGLKDSPSVTQVAAIASALKSVSASTQALLDAVRAACQSS
ncbi:MAG: hypothetical protein WCF04_10410 [Candidatus Nanopelagicales bacterium]